MFFFIDDSGQNVIKRWLVENSASSADYGALQSLIDILRGNGPQAVRSCTIPLDGGFYALHVQDKAGIHACPVFCLGPTSDTEITFLAGARMRGKQINPKYVVGIAEENLEKLNNDPARKRLENIL